MDGEREDFFLRGCFCWTILRLEPAPVPFRGLRTQQMLPAVSVLTGQCCVV